MALVAVGGVCGLAWAAGLRGFMVEIAGPASGVEWVGTFVWILLPGVLTGALLGWAEHLRRTGGRRGWRWLATAPLLFAGVLVHGVATAPGGPMAGLEEFFADGLGGGAIGVPLFGMAGGYALSGRGPLWGRIVSGAIALTPIPTWAPTVTGFGGPELAVTTPRDAWVALYYWSFLAVLALGCAIPHLPVVTPPDRRPSSRSPHDSARTQRARPWRDARDFQESPMSPEWMRRQARRLVEEVWTQGDLPVVDELSACDDLDHSSTPPERTGLAGLKNTVTTLRRAFPDLYVIVEDQIVEADRIVTRSTVRGTHTGELLGLAPTGRQVAFELIDVNRVGDDGRIGEYSAAVDTTACCCSSAHVPRVPRRSAHRTSEDVTMTTTSHTNQPTRTAPVVSSRQPRVGWLSLLVAAGCATIASFVIAMIIAGSIESFFLAMATPIVAGLLVVWRWRRAGVVVLGVVLLAELVSSAPFLADALTHPETPGDFLPLTLFTLATLAGSIAAVPAFRQARQPARRSPRPATGVAATAVVVLVAATAVSIVAAARIDSVAAQPGDIELTTKDFQFDTRTITTDGGKVAVTVTNDDPTRHTFTIDELGVDLNVPPGATQRVTFPADAGTYRFYCIPHAPDMAGELVVR